MAIMDFGKNLIEKYPQLEKLSPTNILEQFENFAPREKNIILIAIFSVTFLIFYLIISSGNKKIKSLQGQVAMSQRVVKDIKNLSYNLKEKNNQISKIRSRVRPSKGFYLASHIENQLTRFQIPVQKLSAEKRKDIGGGLEEVLVDVSVSRISFPKLLNLLSELENSRNSLLRIHRIRIKSIPNDPAGVSLDFKIAAYTKK